MRFRNALSLSVCVAALGGLSFSSPSVAHAQGAPFTVRRPPDGSHVREKVRIEIPRASISAGGFVAFYLDPDKNGGTFILALAPDEDEDASKPFTYVWDTKGLGISDGEHTIKAILYAPASSSNAIAMVEKGTSEIHMTVENKIKPGPDVPTSFTLRYKYREGEQLEYSRFGKSVIVGSQSETGGVNSDLEMMSARSKLLFSVEDVRFDNQAQANVALVRNKLTQLSILNGGQEITIDPTSLSNSMYQELLPEGRVHYETGVATGLLEFLAQGLPVNNTLELPLMPTLSVGIGDQWTTPNQRLDIPGLPPILQPIVILQNKLVDLEYEGGRPCVKIRQTYSGPLVNIINSMSRAKIKEIPFGPIMVSSPTVTYTRDIYLAYNSGTLVRTARTLTIKGRTTSPIGAPPSAGGGGGGNFGGGPRMPGSGGPGFGGKGASFGSGPGMPGSGGGPRPQGLGSGAGPSMPGSGGALGPPPGFGGGPGMPGSGGAYRPGGNGFPPQGGNGFPPQGYGGGNSEPVEHTVTIRSTTDTDIISEAGQPGSEPVARKSVTKPAAAKSGHKTTRHK